MLIEAQFEISASFDLLAVVSLSPIPLNAFLAASWPGTVIIAAPLGIKLSA